MGLDVYFDLVNGETGEKFYLSDEFRRRDLLHIMEFTRCRTGFWGYPAFNVDTRIRMEAYYKNEKRELPQNWFAEEEDANSVWSCRNELEALIGAVEEFIRIMDDANRRHTLIRHAKWHLYYPDADFEIIWWVKDPVTYYKMLGEQLIQAFQLAIDTQGHFIMCLSY
jgi:hypothetical protein